MQQATLTREEVIRTLGDLDDSIVADIISTGATPDDLELAVEQLRNDREVAPGIRAQRVTALRELLAPWWQAAEDEEIYATD